MAVKNEITVKQPEEIPEVVDYLNLLSAWEAFKSDRDIVMTSRADVMETARQILEQLETLRVRADKAVRDAGCSCGPFRMLQNNLSIDWDKVHAAKGRDGFLAVGGIIKEKNDFKGDVNRYLAAKARGMISEEEAIEFEEADMKYQVIKPFNLP